MLRSEISGDLTEKAFEFFYWFSRFEFALKNNSYLKHSTPSSVAMPGWKKFSEKWHGKYEPQKGAIALLAKPPQQELVGASELEWHPIRFDTNISDLEKVTVLLRAVRNNLFHGGKHGLKDWDDPERITYLLDAGIDTLNELAILASIENDFKRKY